MSCCGFGSSAAGPPPPAEGGVIVLDEGSIISPDPFTTLDFQGAGVVASDGGGGVAIITIPGFILPVADEGVVVEPATTSLNFTGGGVVAAAGGAGVVNIAIPGITFRDEGVAVAGAPHTIANFVGAGISAANAGGGVVAISVPGYAPQVQDETVLVATAPTVVNFTGGGVAATAGGPGTVNVAVPGITFRDEGVAVAGSPHTIANFIGAGVAATNAGGGVVAITIAGYAPRIEDEGVVVDTAPTVINFAGAGVAVTGGAGSVDVTIPGVAFSEEGVPLGGSPHSVVNFVGAGVTASDAGGGTATVTVPTNPFSPPEAWVQTGVLRNSDLDMLPLVSLNFDTIKMMRAGSIVGLCTRLSLPVDAGSMTITVYKNGVSTGISVVHTSASNASGGVTLSAPGSVAYVAGDLLGLHLVSDLLFSPDVANAEGWIELVEVV